MDLYSNWIKFFLKNMKKQIIRLHPFLHRVTNIRKKFILNYPILFAYKSLVMISWTHTYYHEYRDEYKRNDSRYNPQTYISPSSRFPDYTPQHTKKHRQHNICLSQRLYIKTRFLVGVFINFCCYFPKCNVTM